MFRSIAHIVEFILQNDLIALEAAKRSILNYNSYARHLQNSIQVEYGYQVKHNTVVVALRRFCRRYVVEPVEFHNTQNELNISIEHHTQLTPQTATITITAKSLDLYRSQWLFEVFAKFAAHPIDLLAVSSRGSQLLLTVGATHVAWSLCILGHVEEGKYDEW